MTLNIRTVFLYVSVSIIFLAPMYHLLLSTDPQFFVPKPQLFIPKPYYIDNNLIIHEQQQNSIAGEPVSGEETIRINASTMVQFKPEISHTLSIPIEIESTVPSNTTTQPDDVVLLIANVSILFPSWEALVIESSSENGHGKNYTSYFCLFDTNEISPARFSGMLWFPDRKMFMCQLPMRVRRRLPFRQPLLTRTPEQDKMKYQSQLSTAPELLRWNFIVYNIIETEDDVVLFAKGINNRQGVNRSPTEFKCLFGDFTVNGVRTSVTSSFQEVFRCQRPDLTPFGKNPAMASLLILQTNRVQVVPSIAYYTPRRKIATVGTKSLLCACTMVYNVAKFLKEWVVYHSKIGIDKFILYDNGSDDDLGKVVNLLKSRGYDIEIRFWLWPKTQEAGFSHATLLAKNSCHWMMYLDVDEFVYSPLWVSSHPSKSLLPSLLPEHPYGQVIIRCYEFGPSNQKKHPLMGVTQGYNCRKEMENRHKSIVLIDAIHVSLLNVIHHFRLKDGYKSKKMNLETMVVNHYKFQAWPEFKAKFRRRVSAYVVDWTRTVNLQSNDRTPGLGHLAVEPDGWAERFCEVHDNRLRDLTRRWFGLGPGGSDPPILCFGKNDTKL